MSRDYVGVCGISYAYLFIKFFHHVPWCHTHVIHYHVILMANQSPLSFCFLICDILSLCAQKICLRGRLYFVIRLSKIQIKVAHAISLFICIGIGCSILYYCIPRKWWFWERKNISGKNYRSSCRCRSRPQKPLPLDFWTASFSEMTFLGQIQKRSKLNLWQNKPVAHMSLSKNVQSVGDTSWDKLVGDAGYTDFSF